MLKTLNLIKFILVNLPYVIRFFSTFLDNIAVYLSHKKASKGPLFAIWDVTDRCNCRCVYCDHWENPNAHKELEVAKKLEIIDRLAEAKVGGISICGGEPLLADGIERVIKKAKSRGLFISLDTNGSTLYEEAEKLVRNGLDSIIVSVETLGFNEHDAIRNHKSLFKKLNSGIEKLRNIRKGSKPYIFTRTLIHKKSYKNLDNFVLYWKSRVDKIIFQPIHNSPNNFLKVPAGFAIEAEEEQEFKKIYFGVLKKHPVLNTAYNRLIPEYFFNFEKITRKYRCFQGTFLTDIDSQGNLYSCAERLTKFGNLLQDSMLTLWNSEGARQFRRQEKRLNKSCWQANAIMNIYLTKLLG